MGLSINTNISAMTAQRFLSGSSVGSASALAKISSGQRIVQAKDDAAALAIGSRLRSEVAGLQQAQLNAGQAGSLLQIADGAMSQVGDVLTRMKSLAVQAASGQLSSSERSTLNTEFQALAQEIDRIAADTEFNGNALINGSTSTGTNINDINAAASGDADNLIGAGFTSINFGDSFGDGAIQISYDQATDVMTVRNLETEDEEAVSVGATAISAGATQTVNFNDIGVEIVLNDAFDKTANISGSNVASVDVDAATGFTIGASEITFTEETGGGTDSVTVAASVTGSSFDSNNNSLLISQLAGQTIRFDDGDGDGEVNTAASVTAVVTIGGVTFTSDAQDLSDTGTDTFTFTDGEGNSFTLQTTVGTAGLENGDTLTITPVAARTPAIEASSIDLKSVTIDGTNPFDFGDIDDATIAFDMTAANAAVGSVTLNGTAFSTNTAGANIDLTSTGTKTATLEDANGNQLVFEFNVTSVFANDDSLSIELDELGQLVGAEAISGSSTSFTFKVGTGTTSANDDLTISVSAVDRDSLGVGTGIVLTGSDATNANAAMTAVDGAITTLNNARASVGAAQSRLDFASANLSVAIENSEAARSQLMDADVSMEMTKFTSQQVLLQAGISMLAQANQQPSLLLRLLQ